MDAPGGRDEGKELEPSVAHEPEGQPLARVEGSAEWAGPGRSRRRARSRGGRRPARRRAARTGAGPSRKTACTARRRRTPATPPTRRTAPSTPEPFRAGSVSTRPG